MSRKGRPSPSVYDSGEHAMTGTKDFWLAMRKYAKAKWGSQDSSGARRQANKKTPAK